MRKKKDERLFFLSQPNVCPQCGGKVAKILYGLPFMTNELQAAIDAGDIIIGECLIMPGQPRWRCPKCELDFYEATPTNDEPAAAMEQKKTPMSRYTSEKMRRAILASLRANPNQSARSLSENLQISPWTIRRLIASLVKRGRIQHQGANKNGYWKVKN